MSGDVRLGSVRIDPPLVLAPMAGITDGSFRRLLRRLGGVGLVSMEFVSSSALLRNERRALQRLPFRDDERPIAMQVYGSAPEPMAEAARRVEALGADVCDINMGCPANKILKGCAGAALMGDLGLARRIVTAVRRAIHIPLTVKFRAGLDELRLGYLELGRICEGEGATAVTLHPRTARQMYRGRADWSRIARLKHELSIPVVGNGDVGSATDAERLLRETGCDGVMIGRASILNPWIFRQTADLLAGREPHRPGIGERRDLILEHFRMLGALSDRTLALHKLRTFTGWYARGLPRGRELKRRIPSLATPAEFVDEVGAFFERLDRSDERAA